MTNLLAFVDLVPADGWQGDAACRDLDPELFFNTDGTDRTVALTTCASCPVRMECLDHALRTRERYGVWGGADERERRRLLRRRQPG